MSTFEMKQSERILQLLEQNYVDAFGKEPTLKELSNSLEFVRLYGKLLGSNCLGNEKGVAGLRVSNTIDEGRDVISTVEKIAEIQTKEICHE